MSAEREYHVTIDFQSDHPDLTSPYKIIGLETNQPILCIDHQIYRGTWATPVGTEMIFDEKGEWILNVEKRLLMEKVEVTRKDETKPKTAREMLIRADMVEQAGIGVDGTEQDRPREARGPVHAEATDVMDRER